MNFPLINKKFAGNVTRRICHNTFIKFEQSCLIKVQKFLKVFQYFKGYKLSFQ